VLSLNAVSPHSRSTWRACSRAQDAAPGIAPSSKELWHGHRPANGALRATAGPACPMLLPSGNHAERDSADDITLSPSDVATSYWTSFRRLFGRRKGVVTLGTGTYSRDHGP
jgi:hypothetical protein